MLAPLMVPESRLVIADNTTANVSTSKHGFVPKAPNDSTRYLDGTGAYSVPGALVVDVNYLINYGFNFAQRQVPGTYTAPAYGGTAATAGGIDGYGADRFKAGMQAATLKYKQTDTLGAQESGLQGRFYGNWQQQTNAGKFIVYQFLEGPQTYDLDGRVVTFQMKMKASAAKTVRLGLIQLNSSGTTDVIPGLMVPTTWGSNSTDPTLGANLARMAPTSVPSGCQGAVNGNAVDCSVTTAWQLFGGTFTVPATANNIAVAIWTDSQFSALDVLNTAEADLHLGAFTRGWLPTVTQTFVDTVWRYCRCFGGETLNETVGWGVCTATNGGQFTAQVSPRMRVTPTLGLVGSVGNFGVYPSTAVSVIALSSLTMGTSNEGSSGLPLLYFTVAATPLTVGRAVKIIANGTLSALLYLEADL